MAGASPIENLMKTTMESLKTMINVNTVVGEPVETREGTVIIPVSKVSFGFVTAGGDEPLEGQGQGSQRRGQGQSSNGSLAQPESEPRNGAGPFTGGTGAGVTVRPVGFLVVDSRKVRFLPVDTRVFYDRLLDEAPLLLEKLGRFMRGDEVESDRSSGKSDGFPAADEGVNP